MKSLWVKRTLAILAGGILGFGYYYFIGCSSGVCPISSNPYVSTAYGGLMGLVLAWGPRRTKQL